jgi:hypothetical protein
MIRITAKPEKGFHRCGMFHPSGTNEYPDDAFTPEQLEILKNEPMLVVQVDGDQAEKPVVEAVREGIAKAAAVGEVKRYAKDAEEGLTDEGVTPPAKELKEDPKAAKKTGKKGK